MGLASKTAMYTRTMHIPVCTCPYETIGTMVHFAIIRVLIALSLYLMQYIGSTFRWQVFLAGVYQLYLSSATV